MQSPAPMFAGIDSLIGILIFVFIAAALSWLQKKQTEGQEDQETPSPFPRQPRSPGAPSPPRGQPQAPRPQSWEEELKRLLEGRVEEAPPPPPPILVQRPSARSPLPPPLPQAARPAFPSAERSPVDVEFKPLPGLTTSVQAYQEASTLQEKVQQHLRQVTRKPVGTTQVLHRAASPEATRAIGLVRDPQAVRSAILASVVLGPPRAFTD